MNARRRATLEKIVATLAPPGARIGRVGELAARAIDALSPQRRAGLQQFLDLLWLPMNGGDAQRAAIFRALATSPAGALRTGFAAVKRLSLFLTYAEGETGNENPMWKHIGYPGPRCDAAAIATSWPLRTARNGERLRANVVVIGSGAGGGVVASSFARAGKRVIVLEAGGAYEPGAFTQRELMTGDLYLEGGLASSSDLGIVLLAGATLGGGTTVNWCTSLQLPDPIAREWEAQSGIRGLSAELAPHYAAIERRLDVRPASKHNANNSVILDGAKNLGVHAAVTPRNAASDCSDGCGYCGFGCAYDKKRSTAATFLHDLTHCDGTIYANATARHIVATGRRARSVRVHQVGARGEQIEFDVEADLLVVSAGALRTPRILARSGIAHPLLGRRLFLHPAAAAIADFDRPIEAWSGPMQSAYSDAFNYRDGNYGAKVEVAPAHPGIAALALPWESRERHFELMQRFRNVATMFALTRDRDPGSIDLDGEAAVRYRLSSFDGANLTAGIAGLFDLGFAAGAVRMMTLHAKPIAVDRTVWSRSERDALLQRLRRIGIAPNRQTLFSAHQMGTASIGSGPADSVVDPAGRVWDYENLIVADASLFPQSSGVNPMLTIMAMASRIAVQHGGAPPHSSPSK